MSKSFGIQHLRIRPGQKVRLNRFDPNATAGFDSKLEACDQLEHNLAELGKLQGCFSAENRRSLLVIFQAMDAGGKDGAIRCLLSRMDPHMCRAIAFKPPSEEELAHDFLWRIHAHAPRSGQIIVFNRSHYEDVLAVRIRKLAPKSVWSRRFEQINDFERMLALNNTVILKFFLHISKAEQYKRLRERLQNPEKHWKVKASDFEDHRHWNRYMAAHEEVLHRCSTKWAPWHVIPSNKKWFRNYLITQITLETLRALSPKWPRLPKPLLKQL